MIEKNENRINKTFEALKKQGKKALIPFVTAGFPYAAITPALMHGMVQAGADIIELGIPFSDPSADGQVIQKAGERALALGVNVEQVLAHVKTFREKDDKTPVVLMGYANPIERYDQLRGKASFAKDAADAGVDGVLIVDYPPQECTFFADELGEYGIDLIFLLAPTSTVERMQEIAAIAKGYVYYVSLKGTTGSGAINTDDVAEKMATIRQHIHIPVGVGFGISDAQTAKAVAQVSDAVIIGSKLIQIIEQQPHEKVTAVAIDFLRTIRNALDAPQA